MAEPAENQGTSKPAGGGRKPLSRSEAARHASLVRWGKEQPFAARLQAVRDARKKKKSGGGGKKPKAAKPTAEQRKEQNANSVRQFMMDNDQGLAPAGFDNLMGLGKGTEPDKVGSDGLIKMGMAERGADGTLRLTPAGRAAIAAANRGDAKGAIDAISRGVEKAGAAATGKEGEEEAPAAGGGGGGGSKKPTKEEKDQEKLKERAKTAAATAEQVGLDATALDALRGAAEGTRQVSPALQKLGLVDGDGAATDQGRRALGALERGDVRQYRAALQDAASRMEREGETVQRAKDKEATAATRDKERQVADQEQQRVQSEREAARSARELAKQQRKDRIQTLTLRRFENGAKLSPTQEADLEEAGLIEVGEDGLSVLTEEGRKRLRKPSAVKHMPGAHNQYSHGRHGGGGHSGGGSSSGSADAETQRMVRNIDSQLESRYISQGRREMLEQRRRELVGGGATSATSQAPTIPASPAVSVSDTQRRLQNIDSQLASPYVSRGRREMLERQRQELQGQVGNVAPRSLKHEIDTAETEIRGLRQEKAIFIGPDGRRLVQSLGDEKSFTLSKDEFDSLRGVGATMTHNHPSGHKFPPSDPRHRGDSFSINDVKQAAYLQLAEVRAVTPTRRYWMKPPPGGWKDQHWQRDIPASYQRHHSAVLTEMVKAVRTGRLSQAEANARVYDEIWSRVSRDLGLSYGYEDR